LKKKIMMAAVALVVLLLLGGGGFMGYRWWSAKNAAKPAETAAGKEEAAKEGGSEEAKGADAADDEEEAGKGGEEGAGGPPVMLIHPIIVNLGGNHRNAFLKCDISILFRDAEVGRQAAGEKPTAENAITKSIVLEALSGKTVEEAMDLDTRESVRQEIKDKLNAKFHRSKEAVEKAKKAGKPLKPVVKDVLITDWAIQQ
jgi:flagellar basal body-associated protein FliL